MNAHDSLLLYRWIPPWILQKCQSDHKHQIHQSKNHLPKRVLDMETEEQKWEENITAE